MPVRAAILVLLLASCVAGVGAGSSISPPAGWTAKDSGRRFVGYDLYGHINGGAELFHEFGFVDLRVRNFADAGGAELDLEIYRMADSTAALGIYLAKCGRERPVAGLDFRNTANAYQLTAVKGDHFVQVNNFGGKTALLDTMSALIRMVLAAVPAAGPEPLLALLDEAWPHGDQLLPGSLRLLRGPLALEPICTLDGNDPLGLGVGRHAVAGRFLDPDAATTRTVIAVAYPDGSAARAALAKLLPGGGAIGDGGEFEDAQGRSVAATVTGRRLRIVID